MPALTLDFFLHGIRDVEHTQYELLSYLQGIRKAFARNVIYPYLAQLVELHQSLHSFVGKWTELRDALPGKLTKVDLEAQSLVYDKTDLDANHMRELLELIRWAQPLVQSTIEEGRTIFEFVEENLTIEAVGVVPSYVSEGYMLVPDRFDARVHVLRYQLSIFAGPQEQYRSLKTVLLKSIPGGDVVPPPNAFKLDLIAEHAELPNPATYLLDTELEFPFRETVLPVAKRKLMSHLFVAPR